ncbi:HxlR family transcriptional regulator [Halioglobus japonicus]|uniref:Transcriptional regulator n=1 Tax=Halioglobus japonicus TaxID=930805 RepID=A0AAP8ME70_9GAMM|nr:winged helix-turn-helix transcriptional regulator [Halioglobus japonicus]AQA18194.1 HxlR family transcriptional regulator [Halioglobus japonicus]PLW86198.1 transcriptional regulator [Halioglobus japonicus]GHD13974.1 transcriptional regulator [Halioglobus japonicus]
MSELITRASSINRALDQIGDKWCLLIIQEVLWGINTFNEMMEAMGVSRGVLSNRLKWLQDIDCLRRETDAAGRHPTYHLTSKTIDLYDCALMAIRWERNWFDNPQLDNVQLRHRSCGQTFQPQLRCGHCSDQVILGEVRFQSGPGATRDVREKKVRRRSSIAASQIPSRRALYRNLINLVGDRWTANVIALSFHGITRFEEFHTELPVATNILADRLKLLVEEGVFVQVVYQERPLRQEYQLTDKGRDMFPWFLALLQWGDKWCDPQGKGAPVLVTHTGCNEPVEAEVCCSECGKHLLAHDVEFTLNGEVM